MSTRFHQWVDHALVVRGLTQILAEGSGCRWGHRVSLVTICDGTLLFDVKDLFDFASVPHPLSATTRSFCRYPGQITGHKCLNKAHRSLLNNFATKQVYYLLSHRCQHRRTKKRDRAADKVGVSIFFQLPGGNIFFPTARWQPFV